MKNKILTRVCLLFDQQANYFLTYKYIKIFRFLIVCLLVRNTQEGQKLQGYTTQTTTYTNGIRNYDAKTEYIPYLNANIGLMC